MATAARALRAEIRQELSSGKYDGIILPRAVWLYRRRADRLHTWEDIRQNLYVWSRVAIDLYDAETGVPFCGFLKHHLRQRGKDWLDKQGVRAKGGKRRKRESFSEVAEPSYRFNIDAGLLIEEQLRKLSDLSRDCMQRLFRFDD